MFQNKRRLGDGEEASREAAHKKQKFGSECRFFKSGHCSFGDRCKNLHTGTPSVFSSVRVLTPLTSPHTTIALAPHQHQSLASSSGKSLMTIRPYHDSSSTLSIPNPAPSLSYGAGRTEKPSVLASNKHASDNGQVCKFFQRGDCNFGASCKNVHPGVHAGHQAGNQTGHQTLVHQHHIRPANRIGFVSAPRIGFASTGGHGNVNMHRNEHEYAHHASEPVNTQRHEHEYAHHAPEPAIGHHEYAHHASEPAIGHHLYPTQTHSFPQAEDLSTYQTQPATAVPHPHPSETAATTAAAVEVTKQAPGPSSADEAAMAKYYADLAAWEQYQQSSTAVASPAVYDPFIAPAVVHASAVQMVRGFPVSAGASISNRSHASRSGGGGPPRLCKFFERGDCSFGDKCRNLHTPAAAMRSEQGRGGTY